MSRDRWWTRMIRKIAALRPASYILARMLPPIDLWFLKISRGRMTLTQMLSGLDIICVDTVGARTNQIRPVVLAAARKDRGWVLAASNFGGPNHPDWFYNLTQYPDVDVKFKGEIRRYRARLAQGSERELCWSKLEEAYQGFAAYRKRAGNRIIPVFVLDPIK